MSNYENNSKPSERLTVAGIAAVIVVGVFVVCVILILAKSLFPSNDESVPKGVYTGTKAALTTTSPKKTEPKDDSSIAELPIIDESEAQTDSSSLSDDSAASGETAYLTQTAYLRSANDENSEPILSISEGETVTVIERPADSEYVHVTYYDYDGWVWYGYLG